MIKADVKRVVVHENDQLSINNLIKNPYKSMTSAAINDDDLVSLIKGEEEQEVADQEVPSTAQMEISLKIQVSAAAAAKLVMENLGLYSSEIRSTLKDSQRIIRDKVNAAATQSEITEFFQ